MAKRKPKLTIRQRLIAAVLKRATITLECLPEHISIEGNASAWGDGTDEAYWKETREKLEAGNDWAWCMVRVTATFKGFRGTDTLGCCSYNSEEDFRQPDGYFDQMVREACGELVDQLIAAEVTIKELLS